MLAKGLAWLLPRDSFTPSKDRAALTDEDSETQKGAKTRPSSRSRVEAKPGLKAWPRSSLATPDHHLPRSPAPLLLPLASLHHKPKHPLQPHSAGSSFIPPSCPSLLFAPITPLQPIPEGSRKVLLQSQLTLLMALLWLAPWCPQDKIVHEPMAGSVGPR